jgi:excisionase family DNA binding protein
MNELDQQSAQPAGVVQENESVGFISASALAARLGVSVGSIRNWTSAGELPAIKLNCGRLIRYDWPSVRAALLRKQRGGG